MNYEALTIADYIIGKCLDDGIAVSNTKLQKLLYFVFGEYHRETNSDLFAEAFLAFPRGPVVAEVNEKYRGFGGAEIFMCSTTQIAPEDLALIDKTIKAREAQNIEDLVGETHTPGLAWAKTVADAGIIEQEIPRHYIYQDFAQGSAENGIYP